MSIGGGEILRAVMSDPANAVDFQQAFYCMTLNGDDGHGGATGNFGGYLQCHSDRYFLMTGAIPCATQLDAAPYPGFERSGMPEFIRIFDPANNDDFVLSPPMLAIFNAETSYNWSISLPEYILWEPGSLIGVQWRGLNYAGQNAFKFLTMVGIEFRMKG